MFGIINFGAGIVLTKDEVIHKKAIEELIRAEAINISGLEVITVGDLQELLEGK